MARTHKYKIVENYHEGDLMVKIMGEFKKYFPDDVERKVFYSYIFQKVKDDELEHTFSLNKLICDLKGNHIIIDDDNFEKYLFKNGAKCLFTREYNEHIYHIVLADDIEKGL